MLTRLRILAAGLVAAAALMIALPARADAPGTIVEVAAGAGTFKTLVAVAGNRELGTVLRDRWSGNTVQVA